MGWGVVEGEEFAMPKTLRALAALTALFLAVGVAPAHADEGDEGTEVATTVPEDEGSHINGKFLILFAEGFDATEEDLVALQELGLGFGDLFKLNLYATVLGVPVDELIAGATFDEETGEWEFGWGELRQSLTDEQLALLEGLPKNFGQFVSAAKRHQGRDAHQPDHAGRDGEKPSAANEKPGKPDKGGKPDHAGKGGNGDS